MKKLKKWMLFSINLLIVLTLAACFADSEDGTSTLYEYSVDEIQQIYQLQEDYGVAFDFSKKSTKVLPTVKDFEELCQLMASLNAIKPQYVQNRNEVVGTISPKIQTRSWNGCMEYSGSYRGEGEVRNPYRNETYGSAKFIVYWEKTNSSGTGSVSAEVYEIRAKSHWTLNYDRYSSSYEGGCGLKVTFYFTAALSGSLYSVSNLELVEHVSMTSSNN